MKVTGELLYYYFSEVINQVMAHSNRSVLLHTMRGAIVKQIVVKQYGKKTVISAYPDMSNVKASKLQTSKRKKFAEAIAYAHQSLMIQLRNLLMQKA